MTFLFDYNDKNKNDLDLEDLFEFNLVVQLK